MKNFSTWLNEEANLRDTDKSEGHKRASLLSDYIDPNDLIAGLSGQPTKAIVYRFLSIVNGLPMHERQEFEKQMQELQMQYGQQAAVAADANAQEQPEEEQPQE